MSFLVWEGGVSPPAKSLDGRGIAKAVHFDGGQQISPDHCGM
jgi:hypothetical protein